MTSATNHQRADMLLVSKLRPAVRPPKLDDKASLNSRPPSRSSAGSLLSPLLQAASPSLILTLTYLQSAGAPSQRSSCLSSFLYRQAIDVLHSLSLCRSPDPAFISTSLFCRCADDETKKSWTYIKGRVLSASSTPQLRYLIDLRTLEGSCFLCYRWLWHTFISSVTASSMNCVMS
jgi:hypothetical protein